jgi:hypothetical protein
MTVKSEGPDGELASADAHGPAVHVENLKTNDEVNFNMPWTATLADVWAKAYELLHEARAEGDQIQCVDGSNLAAYLSKTLEQMRDDKVCPGRKFQIRGPTGGAMVRCS